MKKDDGRVVVDFGDGIGEKALRQENLKFVRAPAGGA
eukprot:gene16819-23910_t